LLSTMLNERPEPVYEVRTASRRVERQLDKVDDEVYPEVAKAIESLANNRPPLSHSPALWRARAVVSQVVTSAWRESGLSTPPAHQ